MTKLLRLVGLLIALILSAQLALAVTPAKIPITGHLGALGPDPSNPVVYQVKFALSYCGANQPKVIGQGTWVATTATYQADVNGLLSGTIWPNDFISCGGVSGNSRYNVTYLVNGQVIGPVMCFQVLSTAGVFNLDAAVPCAVTPPPTPPPPFLDAGFRNLTLAGDLFGNNATFNGFISGLVVNGIMNVAAFPGTDLGQKFASASALCSDAAPCHFSIAPGAYTYATPILLPHRAQGLSITCDRNATLTYTGTGDAFGIQPSVNGPFNAGGTMFDGGCVLNGTAAANSGIHLRAGSDYTVENWTISGFSNGQGIWVDGANVVTLAFNNIRSNQVGIRLSGNRCNGANLCDWDQNSSHQWVNAAVGGETGFAANAVKAYMNHVVGNSHWGAIDTDVVGGSNTQGFNNAFVDNVFENNGTAGGAFGAGLIGFTEGATWERNYFESNTQGLVVGCVNGTPSSVTPPSGYTAQFCGTARKTVIRANFFNDPSTADEALLNFADSFTVADNSVNSNAGCLADANTISGLVSVANNKVYGTGSEICQAGIPGGTLNNYQENGDVSGLAKHFYGATQTDGVITNNQLALLNTGQGTMNSGAVIVMKLGAITVWQSTVQPSGVCDTSGTHGSIWIWPGGMSVCTAGVWKAATLT